MPASIERRTFLRGAALTSGVVALGGLAACSGSGSDGATERRSSTTRSGTTTTAPSAPPLETAFYAGVPLVVTLRTLQTFANLVGVNRLFATKALADEHSHFVVAPNHDTLYAIAVLDLDAGAQVLTLPEVADRYHVVQIVDAWMGGIHLLGTRASGGKAGRWVIARAGVDVDVPEGATRLDSPTRHAFVLGRVRATEDPEDQARAAAIAASIRLDPLVVPPADQQAAPTLPKPVGPPNEVGGNGAAFYDELGDLLELDEPVTDAQRQALAAVDDLVGAGRHPTTEHPDRVPDLETAVADGMRGLTKGLDGAGTTVNGWQVNLDLGTGGEQQSLRDRAVIARYFWGPVPAEEAVYPRAVTADDGEALDGSKRYRIHLDGGDLPPVDGFWSYTVYGSDLYFVPNEIDRFSLSGDTPGLVRGDDGSIDVLLSHDRPEGVPGNWLPIPDGPFTLVMRLYLPQAPIVDGAWAYPPVEVLHR